MLTLFPKDVTYLSARREDWGGTDGKAKKTHQESTMLQAIPPATCEHRRKESWTSPGSYESEGLAKDSQLSCKMLISEVKAEGWDMFILDVYSLWFGNSINLAYLTMLEFNACCMGIKTPVRLELAIRRPWFQEFTPSHGITFESIRNNWIM